MNAVAAASMRLPKGSKDDAAPKKRWKQRPISRRAQVQGDDRVKKL